MASEVETNPFRPGGELSKEVENILKNSTIQRDAVIINDPSLQHVNGSTSPIKPTRHGDVQASPNGPTSDPGVPITCEVTSGRASPLPSLLQVETHKIENAKNKNNQKPVKCCTLL